MPSTWLSRPYTGSYSHCQISAAATSETENGRKYIAAHTLRHRRLTRRFRPRATTSASTIVTGTDHATSIAVLRTLCQNVESVSTFS